MNAVLNATLNQPPQLWWTPLISPVSILFGALVGVFASLFSLRIKEQQEKRKEKLETLQRLNQAYNLLKGQKYMITHSNYEYNKNMILIKSFSQNVKWENANRDSATYDEYLFLRMLGEERGSQLAKENRHLYEIIGMVQNIYPSTSVLDSLIDQIRPYQIDFADEELPDDLSSVEQLEKWETNEIEYLFELNELIYGKPIDNLLIYLNGYIEKTKKELFKE